tara:strand:- start:487 stop:1500 length:1014 start_codon:yes stop_codon:yes gene_type:complete
MKAAILENYNKKLKIIENINLPRLKSGEVLVKIDYTSICYSQIMEIQGHRDNKKYLPHLLGHEGCGSVIKLGKKVSKFKVNDYVIIGWIKNSGINTSGTTFCCGKKKYNAGPVTTFSNYAIISENRLILKPKNISKYTASLYGCAIPTGMGMIVNQIKDKVNKNLCIFGFGGVGIFSLIAAKYYKFKSITIIDINKSRLKLAKKMGANTVINVNKIKKETKDKFDYVIDTAGKIETIQKSFDLIKNNGTCIFCSHPPKNLKIQIDPYDLILGKKIIGSWGGDSFPEKDIKKYVKIIKNSKINLNNIFNKEYKFEDINLAINDFKKGKVLRPIINMNH